MKVWGIISLPVELGNGKHTVTHELDFLVADSDSPYTAILGRPFRMIVSQYYLKAKFMTSNGVGISRSDQKESRSLYLKAPRGDAVCNVETLKVDGRRDRAEPAVEIEEVYIGSSKENTTRIDASLPTDMREKLITFVH